MKDKPVVLIVDDAAPNIQTLAQCLKDDYRIKVATDGVRCLELVKSDPAPDLVLLDVDMPGMNGYEVITHMKQDEHMADVPVIFVTGMDNDEDEEKGLALGAVDYVVKPVRPAIVRARVKTHVLLKQQRDQLAKMAMCDQLTGLYNRHFLIESAKQKVSFSRRHQQPLSVMILDIDLFKQINDQYGHAMGDQVLTAVGGAIQERCRKEDLLGRPASRESVSESGDAIAARYGGEEFLVLLSPCDLAAAQQKAEQLREAVETLQPSGINVSTSIGVAQLQPEETFEALVSRADSALYRAKEAGRNRVEAA
ncbi:MAG: diguanylate cyclase [Oleiphilaceae bacterium]|nr:diguanylate cyclase [Oleiphilaceae bacterium]